jgi:hypothetical protein
MNPFPRTVSYLLSAVCGGTGIFMLLKKRGPNYWLGVRLPWTFADRQIWDKSWRLASIFLTGMGVWALLYWRLFFVALAHFIGLGIIYPIFLYRRKYGTLRYWKDTGRLAYHPIARCRHCHHLQRLPEAAALALARCESCLRPFQEEKTNHLAIES